MEQPELSVIIATRNHAAVLPMCLQHLENQEFPAGRFEVLVADAGSSDGTPDLVRRYASGSPVRVVALSVDSERNVVGALNAGAEAARGRLLLFLAPGLLAGPSLVARHVGAHGASGNVRAVLGAMQVHPQSPMPPFTSWFYRFAFGANTAKEPGFLDWQACNLSLPRKDFLSAGGFDEAFPYPLFHASELGWRLGRAGIRAEYLATAQTYWWQELTFDEALFLRYAQGYCLFHLIQRTHDIEILHRYAVDAKPLRVLLDRVLVPFYMPICRRSAGETRALSVLLRRTLRHYFQQGYLDATAGRDVSPPVEVATYPAA